jgi:sodium/proline symporter
LAQPVLITFIIYFVLLLAVGVYFYRKSQTIEDYLLGGRGMGAWVTALSAQASDMSGWLLMGLPGLIYLGGMKELWVPIGLLLGTILNWRLIAARLRVYTEKTDSITLPCFFEERFKDPTGLLRTVSAIIILIFFTIYATSGLVAAGILFESTFQIPYHTAVITGGVIIVGYTFLGGFLAVCWTDLLQGMLMVIAIIVVPVLACREAGGIEAVKQAVIAKHGSLSLIGADSGAWPLAIISSMAWGLGYFGQPHILARFMSVKSMHKLKESITIAIIWVVISLAGACLVGFIAVGMFDDLAGGEQEKVFIFMIDALFNPWIAGIMLAAILSAIMSTIDSQLLVSSSALTEDFYIKAIKKNASEKEVMIVGRLCVIIIFIIALLLALKPDDTILGIVAYAWGGFGAAFGPLVLFALFSRKTTWISALAGMVTGTVVLVIWKQLGLGQYMYEIVPGFLTNCLTIAALNFIIEQRDETIINKFNEVKEAANWRRK